MSDNRVTGASCEPHLISGSSRDHGDSTERPGFFEHLICRRARLGFTDIYHDRVRRRGTLGRLYVLLFGTPNLGTFANGFYLRRLLARGPFPAVLDAGCGDGTFAFYLASRFPESRVVAVDIGDQGLHTVENTLRVAERIQRRLALNNLEFRQSDLRELPFSDEFDLIYSFDVLEHIVENKLVLRNLHQALRKGGVLLFRIPTRIQHRVLPKRFTAEHDRWAAVEHVGQHYDMATLLADLTEIGYEIRSAEYTTAFWGRLSFELVEACRYIRLPEALLFGLIPLLKLFRLLDTIRSPKQGDGLLVLCVK